MIFIFDFVLFNHSFLLFYNCWIDIFSKLSSELRCQFTNIFSGLIAFQTGTECQITILIQRNPNILDTLISFYDKIELACCAGEMIRVCIKQLNLAKLMRDTNRITKLSSFFIAAHFDVSSDSIKTFEQLILISPSSDEFLISNYELVFQLIHSACDEPHYAACRSLLKLLHAIILQFPAVRDFYTTNEKNLIIIMKLMSSQYQQLRLDAYHVFKYFILQENKPQPVEKILMGNAKQLIGFMNEHLQSDDRDLIEEKNTLISNLERYL
jgi:calcium binding protein 39